MYRIVVKPPASLLSFADEDGVQRSSITPEESLAAAASG
jgi:hypothetical protein